ncbi:20651_t:CDS:1, partial [Gigaspora margarita]
LLIFFISVSNCACDTNPSNLAGCSCSGLPGGLYCGGELGCANGFAHVYQCSGVGDGGICHFGPCMNGCLENGPNSKCQ